jgi:hypothetical protein
VRRIALLRLSRLAPHAALEDFRLAARDTEADVRAAAIAALLVEGTEPVEDWLVPADVPALAKALLELGPIEELARRLVDRDVETRIGAVRALFFVDAHRRAQGLAAARVDPAPRVQRVGQRLEGWLSRWLADPQAARHLQPRAPEPVSTKQPEKVANAPTEPAEAEAPATRAKRTSRNEPIPAWVPAAVAKVSKPAKRAPRKPRRKRRREHAGMDDRRHLHLLPLLRRSTTS